MKQRTIVIAAVSIILLSICFGWAYFIEPARLVVNSQELRIRGWDPAFDGLKVVAIADIHAGSNGANAEQIRRVVRTANDQHADLIVLLGDYVSPANKNDHSLKMPVSEMAKNLSGLEAKYGVFAILGNQDDAFDSNEVSESLRRYGYNVLDGQVATINNNGRILRIAGLRDQLHVGNWQTYSDVNKRLLAPTEGMGDVLVLQHSPDIVPIITGELAISNDLKLMLAGHTHGGQVWLPILGRPVVPSGYGQKYAAGFVSDPRLSVFVTTGVGTSNLPFRLMVPPEIAVLTILSGTL